MGKLDGRVAVVTGAAMGIGRGMAGAMAREGASVIVADVDEQAGTDTARWLTDEWGVAAEFVRTDVTDRAQVEAMVDAAVAEFGRLDVVVNNVGGTMPGPLLNTSTNDLRDAFTFNVSTAHALTTAAVPLMLEHSGGGSVINITSAVGRLAGRGFAAYGTAKAALAHYTKLAAMDLCPKIRVNGIAPGSILTSALDIVASNEALRDPMEKATPMRRLGDPEDIAAAALYLASPAGAYVTGKVLEVDGGLTFPNLDLPIPDL